MNKIRVLIVDDEESLTRLLKMGLEATHLYEVHVENLASRGVGAALKYNPDIILLDVMMPEMTGGDVAAEIRKYPLIRNTPIVFLTAAVKSSEVEKSGGMIGGFQYLAKPADLDTVMECIDRVLSRREASSPKHTTPSS